MNEAHEVVLGWATPLEEGEKLGLADLPSVFGGQPVSNLLTSGLADRNSRISSSTFEVSQMQFVAQVLAPGKLQV